MTLTRQIMRLERHNKTEGREKLTKKEPNKLWQNTGVLLAWKTKEDYCLSRMFGKWYVAGVWNILLRHNFRSLREKSKRIQSRKTIRSHLQKTDLFLLNFRKEESMDTKKGSCKDRVSAFKVTSSWHHNHHHTKKVIFLWDAISSKDFISLFKMQYREVLTSDKNF